MIANSDKRTGRAVRLSVCWLAGMLIGGPAGVCAPVDPLLALARAADAFQQNASRLVTVETLHQTSLRLLPHPFLAVGAAAAAAASPRFVDHEIVSQYSFGHLKGAAPGALLEFRELTSLDGKAVRTPAVARRALLRDVRSGETRIRREILEEFTRFGLVDVATDYGTILLAFTTSEIAGLRFTPAGEAFVGAEEAVRLDWMQTAGGALDFRGWTATRRLLHGTVWLRKSDGIPLRISASFGHAEARRVLRDDAIVDYAISLGFPTPAVVVHRHYVDGEALTENLYTYEPFHLFTTDTTIHYTETVPPPK